MFNRTLTVLIEDSETQIMQLNLKLLVVSEKEKQEVKNQIQKERTKLLKLRKTQIKQYNSTFQYV